MNLNFVTGFPEFFDSPFETSMLRKAIKNDHVNINMFDLKDYTLDKHKTFDDEPFGGKKGMVLKPEPFYRAMKDISKRYASHRVIQFGPEGRVFDQNLAKELSKERAFTIAKFFAIICQIFQNQMLCFPPQQNA